MAVNNRYRLTPATCEECGAAFQAKTCSVAKGLGRFCSVPCSSRANIRNAPHRPIGPLGTDDPRRTHIPVKAIIDPSTVEALASAFWQRVDRRGETECWPWTGAKGGDGYGLLTRLGATYRAPRLSWQIHNSDPLGRMHILHSCDNPICVNPAHLSAGTHSANMRDASSKRRMWRQDATHCLHGHELTPENTFCDIRGGRPRRRCKKCAAGGQRAYKAKKRAERSAKPMRPNDAFTTQGINP